MRIRMCILALTLLLGGCTPTDDPAPPTLNRATAPATSKIAADYQSLILMTKDRVFVDPDLAALCVGASAAQVEKARNVSGPHAHTYVSIYMNDLASDTFRRSATPYPVGSVIVKDKQALDYRPDKPGQAWAKAPDGVGGMIKRPPGYDPAHGDWEYFYFEEVQKIETGRIFSCVQCHDSSAKTDHVFGRWANGKAGRQ